MSSMNRKIGGKVPSKKQINLISTEKPRANLGKTLGILFLVLAVLAGAGYYYMSGSQTVMNLQSQLWALEDELLLIKQKSSAYDQVEEEYIRYSYAHLTEEEKNRLTGMMIIKKIEDLVVPYGFVTEMTINGNTVDFTVYSEDIRKVTDSLLSDPMVKNVTPKSESKQQSGEMLTVTENVSAMIMKTIGGVQVIKRSDDPVETEAAAVSEEGAEAAEGETPEGSAEKDGKAASGKAGEEKETGEAASEKEKKELSEEKEAPEQKTDAGETAEKEKETGSGEETVYVNTGTPLEAGNQEVQVTIVIPPVMSIAQLRVTFHGLGGGQDEKE